jgi:hypothetical protein
MMYVFREDERPMVRHRLEKLRRLVEVYRDHIVPLYRSPPQPRGWLTEEERGSIQHAATCAKSIWSYSLAQELDNLLARSTPPEVVLPNVYDHIGLRPVCLRADVIKALAAAGVAVKEVGNE